MPVDTFDKSNIWDTHFELIVVVTLVICLCADSSRVKGDTFKSTSVPSSVPCAHFSPHNSREVSNPRVNVHQPGSREPGHRVSPLCDTCKHTAPLSQGVSCISVCASGSEMFSSQCHPLH